MMALDFNDAGPQTAPGNVHPLPATPNVEAMRSMVEDVFRYAAHGSVELAWTDTSPPFKPRNAQLFGLEELDALVEQAAKLNAAPFCNVYVSPGLRREDAPRGKRADDAAVSSVAAIKADFDDPGTLDAALQVLAKSGLTPNRVVITSRRPHLRGQAWFWLDEPCADLSTAREIEDQMAKALGGDASVKNPSRVMRLAGSIAWPVKKGRVRELTELVAAGLREAPYTIDELVMAVRRLAKPSSPEADANIFDFNTASRQGGTSLDEYIAAAREPGQWHGSVLRAVAHLTRKGAPPEAIVSLLSHAVTQPGYTIAQTREEIAVMVRGAMQKGFVPEGDAAKRAPAAEQDSSSILHELWPDIDYCYEPELVEELFPQVGLATAYGESTAGKTFAVLDLVSSIAMGRRLFGRDTWPVGVLYLAFEGYHGIKKRIKGIKQEKGLQRVALELVDAPWTLSEPQGWRGMCAHIEAAKVRLDETGYPLGIIVVDTLTSAYAGADPNGQGEVAKAMKQLKRLAVEAGLLVLAIGHTGKDVTKGMAGSFAYKSESDTFIKFQADRDEATGNVVRRYVRVEKVKDGASDYVLSDYSLREVVLGTKPNGKPITTCVVDWIAPGRNEEAAAKAALAEREQAERRDAIRLQVLDGIVASLGDAWMAARGTAKRLREQAGMTLGKHNLDRFLKTFASERADCVEQIHHAGVIIEVRTRRTYTREGDPRLTVHFRVIRDA